MIGRQITLSFFAVVAVSFVVLSVLAWQVVTTRKLVEQNRDLIARQAQAERDNVAARVSVRRVLCEQVETLKQVQRNDARWRKGRSERILREHPRGTPGYPVSEIRRSIRNQELALTLLRPLGKRGQKTKDACLQFAQLVPPEFRAGYKPEKSKKLGSFGSRGDALPVNRVRVVTRYRNRTRVRVRVERVFVPGSTITLPGTTVTVPGPVRVETVIGPTMTVTQTVTVAGPPGPPSPPTPGPPPKKKKPCPPKNPHC